MTTNLSEKPLGPSKYRIWTPLYTQCMETSGPIVCQICGTTHPEVQGKKYLLCILTIGPKKWELVQECCGAVIDPLYEHLGEKFTKTYLEQVAENPFEERFSAIVPVIEKMLTKISLKAVETLEYLRKIGQLLSNGPQ